MVKAWLVGDRMAAEWENHHPSKSPHMIRLPIAAQVLQEQASVLCFEKDPI